MDTLHDHVTAWLNDNPEALRQGAYILQAAIWAFIAIVVCVVLHAVWKGITLEPIDSYQTKRRRGTKSTNRIK